MGQSTLTRHMHVPCRSIPWVATVPRPLCVYTNKGAMLLGQFQAEGLQLDELAAVPKRVIWV